MADASPPPSAVPSGGFGSGFRITDPAATLSALPAPAPYVLAAALAMLFLFSFQMSSKSKLPHLNPRKALELTETRCKKDFLTNSRAMLDSWFHSHSDQAARVIGDAGEVIVLPPGLAHEMRNDPRLSFSGWIVRVGNCLYMLRMCAHRQLILMGYYCRTSMLTSPVLRVSARVAETRELSRTSS
jgi:hypothetical protein